MVFVVPYNKLDANLTLKRCGFFWLKPGFENVDPSLDFLYTIFHMEQDQVKGTVRQGHTISTAVLRRDSNNGEDTLLLCTHIGSVLFASEDFVKFLVR